MTKKRVFVFPFDLLSHYLRCLVYAKKYLNDAEYEVLFLYSKNYENYIHEFGYDTFKCDQFDAEKVMHCSQKFDFSWLNEQAIEKIFLSQVEVIQKLNPDIVLGDVAPTLKMAAEYTGVQSQMFVNGYMTRYYSFQRALSRTHFVYPFLSIFPKATINSITKIAEKYSFKIIHLPFKKLRKKYQLKHVHDYLDEITGEENLICDLEKLFPQKDLPDNFRFIGPLIYLPKTNESEWLKNIDDKKPVIVVSMGSTGNWEKLDVLNQPEFAKYTIITAGDKNGVLHASHIISKKFVNLHEVIKRADLLICHGGNGTIYSGLLNQVYMLCLTSHFEQEWNVQAIERIGHGKLLNPIKTNEWEKIIEESLSIKLS